MPLRRIPRGNIVGREPGGFDPPLRRHFGPTMPVTRDRTRMSQHIKIVVWDSIGNTLLGVRPWSSWDPIQVEHFLREDPAGAAHAPSFGELFADYSVELIWFNSADPATPTFSGLAEDYAASLRFTNSLEEITAET